METWPDALDLTAWRQAYRSLQGPGSPSCPPDDRLIALVLYAPPRAEREELADHIVRCRRCTDLYQLLLRVHHDLTEMRLAPMPSAPAALAEGSMERSGERRKKSPPESPQKSPNP